ncbi:MAG: hypothetical protein KDA96_11460 [Planctomycetaceae bacterium]|nr:hypothetical protein [Planctomycetaceae bacterium]
MFILNCTGCQSKLRIKSALAGHRVKCPQCGTVLQVPEESQSPHTDSATREATPPDETRSPVPSSLALTESSRSNSETNGNAPQFPDSAELRFQADPPVATSRQTSARRRRKRSSTAIWLPTLLILLAIAGGLWFLIPPDGTSEIVRRDLPMQTIEEGDELRLAIPVGNITPGQQIHLEMKEGPNGAVIDQASHEFRWTPQESDGPGTVDVVVLVSNGGTAIEGHFQITVIERDQPPLFDSVNEITLAADQKLELTVSARDPDEPQSDVTYSLTDIDGDTQSATIDSQTGTVNWTPTDLQTGETVTLTIRATEQSEQASFSDLILEVHVQRHTNPVRQLLADLYKRGADAELAGSVNEAVQLPFHGSLQVLLLDEDVVTLVQYESEEQLRKDVESIDQAEGKAFGFPWEQEDTLTVFTQGTLLAATSGATEGTLQHLTALLEPSVAEVRRYVPPPEPVIQVPVLVEKLKPLYEERVRRTGAPRKLFQISSYEEVRRVFADQFLAEHELSLKAATGQGSDDFMTWLNDHAELKEEFFTAIDPQHDNVTGALRLMNQIRTEYPKQVEKYGALAIAVALVWDDEGGVYDYAHHARRTHSTMPANLLAGMDNYRYFLETESVMQGRAQYVPWEFLVHLVNHRTPAVERQWALQNYLPARPMFGKCYADVPYDTVMLQTSSRVCRLDGREYTLPNIRDFGGVCAMQADFAARVGKSMGVPAAYVGGTGRYGGAHAWVMWVELQTISERSIRFTLESHGRYRGDHYYVGNLEEPQTGQRITDRILELRLHQAGADALARRHASRLMALYPLLAKELAFDFETHLEYLSGVIAVNPWSEAAWAALAEQAGQHEFDRKQSATMNSLLNQLFVNFAAFPDFTLTIFGDLIRFEPDAGKRIGLYYQLLELYAGAERPDLAFAALLDLSLLLEQEDRRPEAVEALATAIRKYAEEGQYVPKMLDRLETLIADDEGSEQRVAEFYATFLPKIPQQRGDAPSDYCISMYERAVPIFEKAGQDNLARNYATQAAQLKSGKPQ